jgi:hypothetical protein
MPWDPAGEGNDPQIPARRAEIGYGAGKLYPTPSDDHSALVLLLHWRSQVPSVVTYPPVLARR